MSSPREGPSEKVEFGKEMMAEVVKKRAHRRATLTTAVSDHMPNVSPRCLFHQGHSIWKSSWHTNRTSAAGQKLASVPESVILVKGE